jgi:hypothetical protein
VVEVDQVGAALASVTRAEAWRRLSAVKLRPSGELDPMVPVVDACKPRCPDGVAVGRGGFVVDCVDIVAHQRELAEDHCFVRQAFTTTLGDKRMLVTLS